jgi:hypothetical protein
MYRYLQIRTDPQYAGGAAVTDILEALAPISDIQRTGARELASAPGSPWFALVVAQADAGGNYAVESGRELVRANLVEMICADTDERLRPEYERIAREIGRRLGWEVVVEAEDCGHHGNAASASPCDAETGTFSLRFGTPEHGWLDVTLVGPDGESTVNASDVPVCSLCMLADAVRGVLDGRDGEVTWFLEPAEVRWRFTVEDGQVHVSVKEDHRPARTIGRGTAVDIGLSVWRGLRQLEADPAWGAANLDEVWSSPFPHDEVAAIGERLGAIVDVHLRAQTPR